jgi:hypothetical protein
MPKDKTDAQRAKDRERREGPPLNNETRAVLSAWLSLKTDRAGDAHESSLNLFTSYWRYCKDQSFPCLSVYNFMRTMNTTFKCRPISAKIPAGVEYLGVQLR